MGSFAVVDEIPSACSTSPNYVLYVGDSTVDYLSKHLYKLTNISNNYSWEEDGRLGGVEAYNLAITSGDSSNWFSTTSSAWDDSSIYEEDTKVLIVDWTSGAYLNFPSIVTDSSEEKLRTTEIWVRMNGSEETGITSIYLPNSYSTTDDDFPDSLTGEDSTKTYSYHVFVIRYKPDSSGTYPEITYSHVFNTNGVY